MMGMNGVSMRRILFFFYVGMYEVIVIGVLALAAISLSWPLVVKLHIWEQFQPETRFLGTPAITVPVLIITASCLSIITPIMGIVASCKTSQLLIGVFEGFMCLVAFLWLGIGAWIMANHHLIVGQMNLRFEWYAETARFGAGQQFLLDISESLPRVNSYMNFECCDQTAAISLCVPECREKYTSFFNTFLMPLLYSSVFVSGFLSVLLMVIACLLCKALDDVKPLF